MIEIDFSNPKLLHRLKTTSKKDLLAKAVGIGKYDNISLVDATAGMGEDSFILASLGCKITMIEKNPTIYNALKDALQKAKGQTAEILTNIQLVHSNSLQYLNTISSPIDVIYIDTMFPQSSKTAKPKKAMQIFRDITEDNDDSQLLVKLARSIATKRVVLKRPVNYKSALEADFCYAGKTVRFDVWQKNKSA